MLDATADAYRPVPNRLSRGRAAMSAALPQKLATIVAIDVAGYSAQAAEDQAAAANLVLSLRRQIDAAAAAHGGRIFNTAGDGFMLDFASAGGACAFVAALAQAPGLPPVRFGVHMGDVIVAENGDLLGHGVNVAARLMQSANAGAALVSADVRRMLREPLAARLVARGALRLDKMDETIEVFELGGADQPAAEPIARSPVLVVLPFDNLSGDNEMAFFSDGVSEDILQTVARAAQLKVIGRGSSFQFRGADKSVRKVAAELRASHVLDGSVRKSGARVRVSAHLVEAQTQTTIWSDRYDRQLEDIFDVQDEIAQKVAAALDTVLKPKPKPNSVDPLAYDLYLRAKEIALGVSVSAGRQAATLLEAAVARAPDFAAGWGILAAARSNYRWGEDGEDEVLGRRLTHEAAQRALALDPHEGFAHLALYVITPPAGHFAEAEQRILSALDHTPNEVHLVSSLSLLRMATGRGMEALALAQRAYELDPLHAPNVLALGNLLFHAKRESEALDTILSVLARWPDNSMGHGIAIWTAASMGRWEIVDRYSDPARIRRLAPEDRPFVKRAARAAELIRNPTLEAQAQALAAMEALIKSRKALFSTLTFPAFIGADLDRYYDLIDRASFAELHAPSGRLAPMDGFTHLFLRVNHRLRSDPRFVKLCARLGHVDYWLKSGVWPDCADQVPYDFRAECQRWAAEKPAP